jgi:pimeloyl-ACP methyl ester carboxylesterase
MARFPGSGRWWRHNVAALAAHFRLYLIDLIGFGANRGRQRFVLGDAAALLAAWMGQLGIPRAVLVGYSMGGLIAADLAASHPDLVERLVLVNAAAMPMGRTYLRHTCGLFGLMPSLCHDFLPVLAIDALCAGPFTGFLTVQQLLAADITDRLAAIQAPTLLVWGARDTLIPLRVGGALAARLPGARVVIIPEAGHNPMWERPEAFNRAALAFLYERA